jgi:hypothetical protein
MVSSHQKHRFISLPQKNGGANEASILNVNVIKF